MSGPEPEDAPPGAPHIPLAGPQKTADSPSHGHDAKRTPGLDPAGAAADLRRILGAGGGGAGILAQHAALLGWARDAGHLLDPAHYAAPAREGGLEHRIWLDEATRPVRVIKLTYGGAFGRTVRRTRSGWALGPATPLEYLDRWARHNALFGALTEVLGVVEGDAAPQIVVAQRALRGGVPAPETAAAFLRARGYEPLPGLEHAWASRAEGVALFDARPANFVQIGATPVPFDLIPVALRDLALP